MVSSRRVPTAMAVSADDGLVSGMVFPSLMPKVMK